MKFETYDIIMSGKDIGIFFWGRDCNKLPVDQAMVIWLTKELNTKFAISQAHVDHIPGVWQKLGNTQENFVALRDALLEMK